ncbi:MAG: M23 family metallopeptidase, partial [Candidatus Aminicenantales bacterium]
YAARVGTPVQATADGIVTFVGRNGASGRMIKIRHSQAYETLYLHLRNYARGIRKGAKVKGGQIIGFVGSSGESTGPHLDYRIKYRGKYINPLAWRFKPVNPLRPEYFKDFRAKAAAHRFFLQTPLALFGVEAFPKP